MRVLQVRINRLSVVSVFSADPRVIQPALVNIYYLSDFLRLIFRQCCNEVIHFVKFNQFLLTKFVSLLKLRYSFTI